MFQHIPRRAGAFGALALTGAAFGAPAFATTLEISVTNTAASGGFSITPLFAAFHDGSYDAFNLGTSASAAVEALAEVGDATGVTDELAAADAKAQSVVIAGTETGPPTIDPGETATRQVTLDPSGNRYLSFLSMLVPSNDTFLGTDDPRAFDLFGAGGVFAGDFTIDVTASYLYDAGTEVNDPANGPAFILGQVGTDGAVEGGTVQRASTLSAFAGLETPLGVLDDGLIDFTSEPGAFSVVSISIREVPPAPVPLPATALLGIGGLAALGAVRGRRRAARP